MSHVCHTDFPDPRAVPATETGPTASTTDLVCSTQVHTTKQNEEELTQRTAHLLARVLVKGIAVEALALIPPGFKSNEWNLYAGGTRRLLTNTGALETRRIHPKP